MQHDCQQPRSCTTADVVTMFRHDAPRRIDEVIDYFGESRQWRTPRRLLVSTTMRLGSVKTTKATTEDPGMRYLRLARGEDLAQRDIFIEGDRLALSRTRAPAGVPTDRVLIIDGPFAETKEHAR